MSFSFLDARRLENGAFGCFKNISNLSLPSIDEPQTQLLQSGISILPSFSFLFNKKSIYFESVCETVLRLSMTELDFWNLETMNHSASAVRNCHGLQVLNIHLSPGVEDSVDLSLIHYLKNLNNMEVSVHFNINMSSMPFVTLQGSCLMAEETCLVLLSHHKHHLRAVLFDTSEMAGFKGHGKLRFLYLGDNRISQITENSFFALHSLETLTL